MACKILEEIYYKTDFANRHYITEFLNKSLYDGDEVERLMELQGRMIIEKERYGSWWNSNKPQIRAYRQFNCSILIINFDIYKQDMRCLLRRPMNESELFEREKLIEEVEKKYSAWIDNN